MVCSYSQPMLYDLQLQVQLSRTTDLLRRRHALLAYPHGSYSRPLLLFVVVAFLSSPTYTSTRRVVPSAWCTVAAAATAVFFLSVALSAYKENAEASRKNTHYHTTTTTTTTQHTIYK